MKLAAFTRLESLVEALAQALKPYLDKPFAFFGHSMGALVSFELSRLLRNKYKLRQLNGTPKAVLENAELMEILLPIVRADFTVLETYVYSYEPPLDFPIATFGGLEDTQANYEELEAWREQTNSAFSLDMLPGDHFFINSAQSLLLESLAN
ncbi:hypothetical protein NUACC26_099640 [Scytonema sp. NUACC26]